MPDAPKLGSGHSRLAFRTLAWLLPDSTQSTNTVRLTTNGAKRDDDTTIYIAFSHRHRGEF